MATPKMAYVLTDGQDRAAIADTIEQVGLTWIVSDATTADRKTGDKKKGRYIAPIFELATDDEENGLTVADAESRLQEVLAYYQEAYGLTEEYAWQAVLTNIQRMESTDLKNALRAQLNEDPATAMARRVREGMAKARATGNDTLIAQLEELIRAANQD